MWVMWLLQEYDDTNAVRQQNWWHIAREEHFAFSRNSFSQSTILENGQMSSTSPGRCSFLLIWIVSHLRNIATHICINRRDSPAVFFLFFRLMWCVLMWWLLMMHKSEQHLHIPLGDKRFPFSHTMCARLLLQILQTNHYHEAGTDLVLRLSPAFSSRPPFSSARWLILIWLCHLLLFLICFYAKRIEDLQL